MKKGLFSIAYLPPLDYWAALINCDEVWLEAHENFPKQSYRNRCYIDSPNGLLLLNFPISHTAERSTGKIALGPHKNWRQKHWQAIQTSYGSAPFFEAVADDLRQVYQNNSLQNLWDFNLSLLHALCHWLRLNPNFKITQQWHANPLGIIDYREQFHPKKSSPLRHFPSYPQVFDQKFGFRPNLSLIDLVFNEGPAAYDYLSELNFNN